MNTMKLELWDKLLKQELEEVASERIEQLKQWGIQEHDLPTWITILGEEHGELCMAALHAKFDSPGDAEPTNEMIENVYREAKQVAAVAVAIMTACKHGGA